MTNLTKDDIEDIREQFEIAFGNGENPAIDAFLTGDGPARWALLLELVHSELELRLQAGQPAALADYLARYPELENFPEELARILETEVKHHTQASHPVSLSDYEAAYPQLGKRVRDIFRRVGDAPPDVPGYELLDKIGQGGMGVVYRARQEILRREVAVKVILGKWLGDPATREKIVRRMKKEPLALAKIARGIQAAHDAGIIHRDLKPDNILLKDDREPKVADFGLARPVTAGDGMTLGPTNQAEGTPHYMSPEQAMCKDELITPLVDVHGLGAVLYACLTGRPPFVLEDLVTTLKNVKEVMPVAVREVRPEVPRDLETICMKCLQKEPGKRYASAAALADDLQRYLAGEPILARPVGPLERASKWVKRNKTVTIAALAVAFALLAGTAVSLWQAIRATEAAEREAEQKDIAEEKQYQAIAASKAEEQAKIEAQKAVALTTDQLQQIELINDGIFTTFSKLDINEVQLYDGKAVEYNLAKQLIEIGKKFDANAIRDPLLLAKLRNRLGQTLLSYGEAAAAIDLLNATLEVRLAKLGRDHPDTITSMGILALAYEHAGKLDKALPLLKETLTLMQAKLGLDHPDTHTSMGNLSGGYQQAGMFDKAILLAEETLRLRKAKLGPDHPQTLISRINLAMAYRAGGKLSKAIPLAEETLLLVKVKFGPDHPTTLQTMNNLAVGYLDAEEIDKALPLLEETLTLRKAKLGRDHPGTLETMNNLAAGYLGAEKIDLGLNLLDETLKFMKAKRGSEHPSTLQILNNLAMAYRDAGKLDKAVPLLEETLNLRKAKLGLDHPDTLQTMGNLALGYLDSGKLDKALPLLEETLTLQKARLGPEHPDTLDRMKWLGVAYCEARKWEKAAPLLNQFIAASKNQFPKDNLRTAGAIAEISLGLLKCEQFGKAETMLRECLSVREKTQPEAWTTFNTRAMLGGALLGQKKYADPEPLLLNGYEGMKAREKAIPPQGGKRIPEVLDRLIALYTVTKKPDEAKKFLELRAMYAIELAPAPRLVK